MLLLPMASGCSSLTVSSLGTHLASHANPPEVFRRGNISNKESAEACIAIAEGCVQSGHLPAAIAQYQRARQQDPRRINFSHRLAILNAQLGHDAKARKEFAKAIAHDSKDADVKNDYAYFLTQSGDLAGGEKLLREVLAQQPDHTRAEINLGINLTHQDRLAEAHQHFAKATDPASAHHNIGVILSQRGKQAEADAAFQLAFDSKATP